MSETTDLLGVGQDWRIKVVEDIDNRDNYSQLLFADLPRDSLYDLHIEYKTSRKVKPIDADNLTYEELRGKILDNLIIPSNWFMNIFVASEKRGKR